jgi:hypothetical protein
VPVGEQFKGRFVSSSKINNGRAQGGLDDRSEKACPAKDNPATGTLESISINNGTLCLSGKLSPDQNLTLII